MARNSIRWAFLKAAVAALALSRGVLGDEILETIGFSSCGNDTEVRVNKVDIKYNNDNKTVTFDVSGTSSRVQNVTAELNVNAYGIQIYKNQFNPCDAATFVQQLCPVPAGTFSARGSQQIPAEFAKLVPGIAFQIPDIAAMATLELRSVDSNRSVACIQSKVSNGKTASVPSVSYVAAGIAGAALVVTGASALGAAFASGGAAGGGGSTGGAGTMSPSFSEVIGYFQGMAMNGMLSVNYPPIYRSFTKNFGFSMGLIPWTQLQSSIDDFRGRTGGNLTQDSVEVLQRTTLVFQDGSTASGNSSFLRVKRALDTFAILAERQIETSISGNTAAPPANSTEQKNTFEQAVSGIQAYVNQLSVPKSNTFMTVLLVVAIVIAAIAVGILLVKVILEAWALFGNFPKSLAGFRKHYWGSIARAITALIFLLYGIWVLYCIFQFTQGDSWGAKALAGVTLALFTGILIFFSWKIWKVARKLKKAEGDATGLYDEKSNWVKYSLFYDCYKKSYWWLFLPTIIYMFVKGAMLAAMDGKGMAQTVSQIVIEAVMLILLLWSRPYERKSGNVINVTIQVVRVLSVVLILVFVQELEIAQTTQTVAGFALIVVQSVLTGVLAILIIWNAINQCCQRNPHRQRRKEMEKRARDMDNLTPLDARNSLLLDRPKSGETSTTFSMSKTTGGPGAMARSASPERYLGQEAYYDVPKPQNYNNSFRPITPNTPAYGDQSRDGLMSNAAPIGRFDNRQPTLPNLGLPGSRFSPDMYGGGYNQGYGNGHYRSPSGGRY